MASGCSRPAAPVMVINEVAVDLKFRRRAKSDDSTDEARNIKHDGKHRVKRRRARDDDNFIELYPHYRSGLLISYIVHFETAKNMFSIIASNLFSRSTNRVTTSLPI